MGGVVVGELGFSTSSFCPLGLATPDLRYCSNAQTRLIEPAFAWFLHLSLVQGRTRSPNRRRKRPVARYVSDTRQSVTSTIRKWDAVETETLTPVPSAIYAAMHTRHFGNNANTVPGIAHRTSSKQCRANRGRLRSLGQPATSPRSITWSGFATMMRAHAFSSESFDQSCRRLIFRGGRGWPPHIRRGAVPSPSD
jgi:hypothetical protein